jgi:hypothetical protein
MIALLGFLHHVKVLVELLFIRKSSPVHAGQAIGILIAMPVAGSQRHDLECAGRDSIGRRHVRTATQVFPILSRGAGGVPAQAIRPRIRCPLGVVQLVFACLSLELHHPFFERKLVAGEWPVFCDDLFHLTFNRCKILGADGPVRGDRHVVVKTIVHGRTVHQLHARNHALNRFGHDVGRAVPDEKQRIRRRLAGLAIHRGDDRQVSIAIDDRAQIAELAVDFRADCGFRQARADVAGDLCRGPGGVVLSNAAIRQFDANHE